MRDTYVVISRFRDSEDEVLYAGVNEERAKSFTVDETNTFLSLQVWLNGELVSQYMRTNVYKWILEFDKRVTIKRRITELENELSLLKSQLAVIDKN